MASCDHAEPSARYMPVNPPPSASTTIAAMIPIPQLPLPGSSQTLRDISFCVVVGSCSEENPIAMPACSSARLKSARIEAKPVKYGRTT